MPHKPMSSKEYRAACEQLGLSPSWSAAPALGISQVSAARYCAGRQPVPMPIALLLRTMIALQNITALAIALDDLSDHSLDS